MSFVLPVSIRTEPRRPATQRQGLTAPPAPA